VGQKRLDFNFAEFAQMVPIMESNKMLNPANVGLLRSVAVVLETNSLPDDLQQYRLF
jgi:hypothetical protein